MSMINHVVLFKLKDFPEQEKKEVIAELKAAGRPDVPVIIGGIILQHQVPTLKAMGVRKVLFPGTPLSEIVEDVRAIVKSRDV